MPRKHVVTDDTSALTEGDVLIYDASEDAFDAVPQSSLAAGAPTHASTTGQTADDHHAQSHDHSAAGDNVNLDPTSIGAFELRGTVTVDGETRDLATAAARLQNIYAKTLDVDTSILPETTSAIDLGSASKIWQAVHAEGIAFPATQVPSADANTLDDYEEGLWTPTLDFATTGDLSVAYSTQTGRYTRIGRWAFCTYRVQASTFTYTTAAGVLKVGGLPFTTAALSNGNLIAQGWTATESWLIMEAQGSQVYMNPVLSLTAGSAANTTTTHWPSGGSGGNLPLLSGSIAYEVA